MLTEYVYVRIVHIIITYKENEKTDRKFTLMTKTLANIKTH